ncbi:SPASM domain-containing protein [Enterovibrio nigricans]|uniref:Anaerobic sulfatase-maturating enzyme n=1 Tax=Enterovibrio nigricans DSM 22720 TaxID=1121868 RepID=A0A1T4V7K9_9GAMM|nr:SPASM domain-containing protein [Enterovibrio nigricans]SKA60842.1 anaerobic sulfatase-maturating enzyme [Enterovibrio nigricans DSM 22720]
MGISIDGPRALHDCYRVKRNGEPTFDRVMAAIDVLKRHRVRFNTLTVVHNENANYPREVYEFLISTGSEFLQFIPLVERASNCASSGLNLVLPDEKEASVTPWSVGAAQFGHFLTDIFDLWVTRDVGRVFVQMFDSTLASHLGYPATLCSHAPQCGSNFAIESNGDVYACDHYVYPEHKLGNVHSETLRTIRNSVENRAFGLAKTAHLSNKCEKCAWRFACHGGCPKHRFVFDGDASFPVHYLCPSYAHFFSHTKEKMTQMAALILRGKSPIFIMK